MLPSFKRALGAPLILVVLLATAVGFGPSARAIVAPDPHAVGVLVNKQVRLPAGFVPRGLVVPRVRFIFSGFDEKRQLARVAAHPLRQLFAAAARAGAPLAAVSGYRSEATQRSLFEG